MDRIRTDLAHEFDGPYPAAEGHGRNNKASYLTGLFSFSNCRITDYYFFTTGDYLTDSATIDTRPIVILWICQLCSIERLTVS
jgi:hypothetical protein